MISRSNAGLLLVFAALATAFIALLFPAIPQPQSYHHFADPRSLLGIPNFGDVASNLGFLFVGAWGSIYLLSFKSSRPTFADPRERWPYLLLFAGMVLTAFGSAYYHLAPDNARLVWDRLPMTIVFMSLITAMVAERVCVNAASWLFLPLLIVGMASVWQWRQSELSGQGDLRFYAAVQVYAIVTLLLMLAAASKYTHGWYFGVVVIFYIAAKLLETYDRQVFTATHDFVSGHTLKHLAAAAAGYCILRMLQRRSLNSKPLISH